MYFCTCVYVYKYLFMFSFNSKISLKSLVLEYHKTGGEMSDLIFQYLLGCFCFNIYRKSLILSLSLCIKHRYAQNEN